jgi:hypothetical protein
MKKSKTVTLVLLTSSLFIGCGEKARNQYASWDDCVKDYKDPTKCETEQVRTNTGGYHTYYHGPWYRSSSGYDPAIGRSAAGVSHAIGVTRGGFGSHGGYSGS